MTSPLPPFQVDHLSIDPRQAVMETAIKGFEGVSIP